MNFLTLAGLSAVLHGYVALRLIPDLAAFASARLWLAAVLLASMLLIPLGLMARRIARVPLADRLGWAGLLCMGLFSTLMVLTLVRDATLGLLWAVGFLTPGGLELAPWRTFSAQAVPLLGGLSALLGLLNARRTAAVVRVDVPIPGLPLAWQGFTVAQISDIHVGPTIRQRYVRRIVERVNTLQADLVAITGDLVDGRVVELAAQVAPLADLRSRHGTFFVTGNHEYYSGAPAWIDELRRLGMTVLLNEHVVIPAVDAADASGGADRPLVLAGVTDFNAGYFDPSHRSDPVRALAGAPADAVRVLLAHQPRSAAAAAEAGFDLQLSGHTHGGQFYPWNLFVRLQQPFTAGLHRWGTLWVYTSRGTGYWGPPNRFGSPSEITCVRLVAA
ncbi:Phosphoesterase [Polaromonas sp. CG9_12]|uniref:metallophosphoesterase n=1 Tax=Polaromonas sp. CG_9.11 TaxID=2787730 RepID=UPI0004DDD259|nr:metallophosphoesterase [Polaromonas sp. CG_9.11]MBG6078078.1 putative MPP superfamily phosphohydrolase [Polaromonas sp. CG_9.11]CDS52867.1 Phosphoesterase [Polaromonas sp. CG9_12]